MMPESSGVRRFEVLAACRIDTADENVMREHVT